MKYLVTVAILLVAGCVETSVQPLSQTSFKISTEAEDVCGSKGTREIAFREAAVEVIRRGADRFVVVGDQSKSAVTGAVFTTYGGLQTYGINSQDMVIQIVRQGDPEYSNALSARQTLGPDWQEIVAKGSSGTCF